MSIFFDTLGLIRNFSFRHGVEILDSGPSSSRQVFTGTGYKLGQTENDSVTVPGGAATGPTQPVQIALKLWRDGFSLNEGPVREYADPSNKDFLDSIRRGEIPQELRQGNTEVCLYINNFIDFNRWMTFFF